jgi:uncharacterized membrane protein
MMDLKLEVLSLVSVFVVVRRLLVVIGAVRTAVQVVWVRGSVFLGFSGVIGSCSLRLSPLKRLLMVLSIVAVVRSRVSWFLGSEQMNSRSLLTLSRDEVIQGTG